MRDGEGFVTNLTWVEGVRDGEGVCYKPDMGGGGEEFVTNLTWVEGVRDGEGVCYKPDMGGGGEGRGGGLLQT